MKLKIFSFEINALGAACSRGRFQENFKPEEIENEINSFSKEHQILTVDIKYHTIDRHNNGGSDLVMAFYHVWYEDKE